MSERSDKPLIMLPGPVPGAKGGTATQERRISPRYPFTASAEIFDIGSQVRVAGRSSDLSSEGCYIDTISPFATGAVVRVRLSHGHEEFEAKAAVAYSLQLMGMGLQFTEITTEKRTVLQKWISELKGERLPDTKLLVPGPDNGIAPTVGNMRVVLNELINMLIRARLIEEKEGAGLLRQLFR